MPLAQRFCCQNQTMNNLPKQRAACLCFCNEYQLYYAFSKAAISSFFICNIACMALCPLLGLPINCPMFEGTICQETPNLSLHHPHILSFPPSLVNLFQ